MTGKDARLRLLHPALLQSTAENTQARNPSRVTGSGAKLRLLHPALSQNTAEYTQASNLSPVTGKDARLRLLHPALLQSTAEYTQARHPSPVTGNDSRLRLLVQVLLQVTTAFTIKPSGGVSGARVRGPVASSPAAGCVKSAITKLRFPRFRGPAKPINYPFFIK